MKQLLLFAALSAIAPYLIGCAQTPITAPSTKPLQEDLGRAQTHINQAQSISQTIHDKDELIDAYYKWKATHKQ
jgi:hypothetical protein